MKKKMKNAGYLFITVFVIVSIIALSGCLGGKTGDETSAPPPSKEDTGLRGGDTSSPQICTCGCGLDLNICKDRHPNCPVSNPK